MVASATFSRVLTGQPVDRGRALEGPRHALDEVGEVGEEHRGAAVPAALLGLPAHLVRDLLLGRRGPRWGPRCPRPRGRRPWCRPRWARGSPGRRSRRPGGPGSTSYEAARLPVTWSMDGVLLGDTAGAVGARRGVELEAAVAQARDHGEPLRRRPLVLHEHADRHPRRVGGVARLRDRRDAGGRVHVVAAAVDPVVVELGADRHAVTAARPAAWPARSRPTCRRGRRARARRRGGSDAPRRGPRPSAGRSRSRATTRGARRPACRASRGRAAAGAGGRSRSAGSRPDSTASVRGTSRSS